MMSKMYDTTDYSIRLTPAEDQACEDMVADFEDIFKVFSSGVSRDQVIGLFQDAVRQGERVVRLPDGRVIDHDQFQQWIDNAFVASGALTPEDIEAARAIDREIDADLGDLAW